MAKPARPRFNLDTPRPNSSLHILPGETLFKYLDRRHDHSGDYARREWNKCIDNLSETELEHAAPRLLAKDAEVVHGAYAEIRLKRELLDNDIYCQMILEEKRPDIRVPFQDMELFIEVKSRWESDAIRKEDDIISDVCRDAAKYVRHRNACMDILEHHIGHSAPSPKRLARWFDGTMDRYVSSGHNDDLLRGLHYIDETSGFELDLNILIFNNSDDTTLDTLYGLGGARVEWDRSEPELTDILGRINEQHKSERNLLPAIAWHNLLRTPGREALAHTAASTPHGIISLSIVIHGHH